MRKIWDAYLTGALDMVWVVDKYGDVVWFIQGKASNSAVQQLHLTSYLEGTLEMIQEVCHTALGLKTGFTLSGASEQWCSITRQYEKLRQLQQHNGGSDLHYIVRDSAEHHDSGQNREMFIPSQLAESLAAHLEAGRQQPFFEELSVLSEKALHCASVHRAAEAYYSVALVLYTVMNRIGMTEQTEAFNKLLQLKEHSSMKDAFAYVRITAETIFQHKKLKERDRATQVIDRICQYIDDHLSEDLSLVRLAELHYFNPSYLSRFFKQEKGVNLSEYIDRCRVRKAKELLQSQELMIREVAAAVGYEAAHSFTRFFKKVTGLTPQEYRDSYISS